MKLSIIVTVSLALLMTTSVVYIDQQSIQPIKVSLSDLTKTEQRQVRCLADNIYFEARGESLAGKIAVANVTLNRVESGKYAKTICGVVRQKTKGVCQFSWWCDDELRSLATSNKLTKTNKSMYNKILDIALFAYMNNDMLIDNTLGATYYHAKYVQPNWRQLKKTVRIGNHIFYTNGDLNGRHDEEIKYSSGSGQLITFVFLTHGRNLNAYLQTNNRVDI